MADTDMESLLVDPALSISRGIPLSEEEGIGALTLGGYVREIAARYGLSLIHI